MTTKVQSGLAVFAGGALGSLVRYLLAQVLPMLIGLWVVNLAGAAFLGYIQGRARHSGTYFAKPEQQLFWGAGFSGGFTTMSSLAVALVLLDLKLGIWQASAYAFGQVVLGLIVHRVAIGLASKGGDLD